MEIKDAIISTLAEIENITNEVVAETKKAKPAPQQKVTKKVAPNSKSNGKVVAKPAQPQKSYQEHHRVDELEYLKSVRDRVLVLFEGLQSPNNQAMEKKVDMILKFMEFQLATIDERIKIISKK